MHKHRITDIIIRGVSDKGREYDLNQKLHLINHIGKWGGNTYAWNVWDKWQPYFEPITQDIENMVHLFRKQCEHAGIALYVIMRPGDRNKCKHLKNRKQFNANAEKFIKLGVEGIIPAADDTHPSGYIHIEDGMYHAELLSELADTIGNRLKAFCGEAYVGKNFFLHPYWEPILKKVGSQLPLCWVGPGTSMWYGKLEAKDIPEIANPIIFFDNFYAKDSMKPEETPIKAYDGRGPKFLSGLNGVLINPNYCYPRQIIAIQSALRCLESPTDYQADQVFYEIIADFFSTCQDAIPIDNHVQEVIEDFLVTKKTYQSHNQRLKFRLAMCELSDQYWAYLISNK